MIYVPCDQDEEQFKNNYALMPWLSIRFGDERIAQLHKKFAVKQIPYVVILDPLNDYKVISIRGRKEIQDQPNECLDLWLSRQQKQRYTDPVPDTPVSVTYTDEALEAIKVYKAWEEERRKEKEEEKEREERHAKYGVS